MKKHIYLVLLLLVSLSCESATGFVFRKGENLHIAYSSEESEVVHTAIEMFAKDYNRVFKGEVISRAEAATVHIATMGQSGWDEMPVDEADLQLLRTKEEGFLIVAKEGKLIVLGSDKRGTAYGILQLSRIIGVSPWEWWADSPVAERKKVTLKNGFKQLESPSVARRGIFLNDEDWGLTPWSYLTNEPSEVKGQIGPHTHARIFELLLRLRANTFWPAMHDCSVAFYLTPGNKEMADKYGIYIGTSHCEPMMRNTNAEWRVAGEGKYDYVNNRQGVLTFWEERVKELAGADNIYTLGIRGVHDSKMLGANTLQEQKDALTNVLKDQREMIGKYVNQDVEKVSQVFIPYKEVLDVYNMGLEVPDDVTLLWCDDNYGYIRHFPTYIERARRGGNGIYYHISYWGRPHDYLWLSTAHPALLYTQMKQAYDKGAKDMWIINVGDIKPAEYQIELLMDMAWNIRGIADNREGLDAHLLAWLTREFGRKQAKQLLDVMTEHYRLAYIRKPEFMGNTRTEERDPAYKVVSDLPWSEQEVRARLEDYARISQKVQSISGTIPPERHACWFQLVEYPVRGAAEMNKKHLYAQLARHGKGDWQQSDAAYNTIVSLTERYNTLSGGKWRHIMDAHPRRLPVFDKVPRTEAKASKASMVEPEKLPIRLFNGTEYDTFEGKKPLAHGLGYQRKAISLPFESAVTYGFNASERDTIQVEISLAPNHPVEGDNLRYAISVDNEAAQTVSFQTVGRSEEWKQNVLRNQAIRITTHRLQPGKKHKLRIVALDEGVVIDQIQIF